MHFVEGGGAGTSLGWGRCVRADPESLLCLLKAQHRDSANMRNSHSVSVRLPSETFPSPAPARSLALPPPSAGAHWPFSLQHVVPNLLVHGVSPSKTAVWSLGPVRPGFQSLLWPYPESCSFSLSWFFF